MKLKNTTEWIKRNKGKVIGGARIIAASGAAFWLGQRTMSGLTSLALEKALKDGRIILTKPSDDGKIVKLGISEWMQETYNAYKK